MYNPYIVGKHIYLRAPMEEDALGHWHEWFSDEETTKHLADRFWPNTREEQLAFLKLLGDRGRLALSVVCKKNDQHIGVVSLNGINWVHRYADIAIVIGDKEYHRGAYAIEAFSLMLKTAFVRLNLKTIKSAYAASNEASRTIHSVFKFTTVGTYKNILFIDGRWDDLVATMLDQETWLKRNMA